MHIKIPVHEHRDMQLVSCLFVLLAVATIANAYPGHWQKSQDIPVGEWAPPGPGDVRSPCPALNTLANHGYLPRNGKNIAIQDFQNALGKIFLMSANLTNIIAAPQIAGDGQNGVVNLDELDNHATGFEHDASMTRNDYYFGNNYSLNVTLLASFINASSDGVSLTVDDIAAYQSSRQQFSRENNPTFTWGEGQQRAAGGEPALILLVFGEQTNGNWSVPVASIQSVFGLEMLPPGYQASNVLEPENTFALAGQIASKWKN